MDLLEILSPVAKTETKSRKVSLPRVYPLLSALQTLLANSRVGAFEMIVMIVSAPHGSDPFGMIGVYDVIDA